MPMQDSHAGFYAKFNKFVNFQSFRAGVAFATQFLSRNMLFALGHGFMAAATHSAIVLLLCNLAEFLTKSAFGTALIPGLFNHLGTAVVSYLPTMLVPFAPYLLLAIPLSIFTLAVLRGDVPLPGISSFAEADKSFLFLMFTMFVPVGAYLYGFSLSTALIGAAVVASPWNILMPLFQEAMLTYQESLLAKNRRTPIAQQMEDDINAPSLNQRMANQRTSIDGEEDEEEDMANQRTPIDDEEDEEQNELFDQESPAFVQNFARQAPDIHRFGKPIPPPDQEDSPNPRYR